MPVRCHRESHIQRAEAASATTVVKVIYIAGFLLSDPRHKQTRLTAAIFTALHETCVTVAVDCRSYATVSKLFTEKLLRLKIGMLSRSAVDTLLRGPSYHWRYYVLQLQPSGRWALEL